MYKSITSALFVLFVLILPSHVDAQKWTKYTSPAAGFTIKLPAEPSLVENKDESIQSEKYKLTHSEMSFIASASIHELAIDDPSLTKVSIDAFRDQLGAEIITEETWKVKKKEGKFAAMSIPDSDAKCHYYILMDGYTQYQFVIVGLWDNWDEKLAKKFIKSVRIKK